MKTHSAVFVRNIVGCSSFHVLLLCCGETSTADDTHNPEDLTPLLCREDQPPLTLDTVPPRVPVGVALPFFHLIAARCAPLNASQIEVSNTSSKTVLINNVGTSNEKFVAVASSLPRELAPGERLPIDIDFRSAQAGESNANLAVVGPDGCSTFALWGNAVTRAEPGLFTYSADPVDFGRVPVSGTSVLTLSVLYQHGSDDDATFGGFNASPEAMFVILSESHPDVGSGCERIDVSVQFSAPNTPGVYTGYLGWDTLSGGFAGLQMTNLIATAE